MEPRTLASFRMVDDRYELECQKAGSGDPVVTVVAGVHGDERPAMQVADRLIQEADAMDLKGTLRVIPRANVLACIENTRETPWPRYEEYESEERNLNRCFDVARKNMEGDEQLNLTQRMAYAILSEVKTSDYLIDLHTATWPGKKLPQARMKRSDAFGDSVTGEMEQMVRHAGLSYILKTTPRDIGGGVLAGVAPALGVPAVTLEIGGSRHFSGDDFATYRETVHNLLGYADVIDRQPEPVASATVFKGLKPLYTATPGMIERQVELGDTVEEGETVAVIHGIDDSRENVRSPVDGVVENLNQREYVNQGIRVAKIAYTT
jgi:predicted deacylase